MLEASYIMHELILHCRLHILACFIYGTMVDGKHSSGDKNQEVQISAKSLDITDASLAKE